MKRDIRYNGFDLGTLTDAGWSRFSAFQISLFFSPILFFSVQTVTALVRAEIKPPSLLDLGESNRSLKHAESQICLGFNMVTERYWTSPSIF